MEGYFLEKIAESFLSAKLNFSQIFFENKTMTVNTKQLHFILDNTPAEQNIMLIGKHGIGKSRILEDYFSKKGAKVVTLFLGQMSDPGDLIGLPEKNEKTGKTDFMLPYWFPTDDTPIVLFLDELNRARPEVLQTIMDLTLNRKLAGKKLPQGSRIISAVNNGAEYQLTDLDPALVSRFNIYEFAPTVENWIEWAKEAGLDGRVISFIEENPEYLDSEEEAEENLERTPDRRSWERTSNIIKNDSDLTNNHLVLLSGIIGNKAASLFYKHVQKTVVITPKELISSFESVKEKLEGLTVPQFSELNKGIFKFLEQFAETSDEGLNLDSCSTDVIKNLNIYFDYLSSSNRKEIQAHFVSLIDAEKYPAALNLISDKGQDLYKKIMASLE